MILAHGSALGAPLFSSQGFPAPPMRYFIGDVCVWGGGSGGQVVVVRGLAEFSPLTAAGAQKLWR